MGDAYPEVRRNREMIEKTILAEENRFETVLTEGLPRLEAEIAKVLGTKSKTLPGAVAFQLYDTFGIPYDFIEDTAATQGVTVDKAAFDAAMEGQRDKARAGSAFGGKKGEEFGLTPEHTPHLVAVGDHFEGYGDDAGHRRAGGGAVRRAAAAGRRARDERPERLRGAGADAVLPRVRRPGVGHRPHRQRGDRRVGGGRRAGAASAPACRARIASA